MTQRFSFLFGTLWFLEQVRFRWCGQVGSFSSFRFLFAMAVECFGACTPHLGPAARLTVFVRAPATSHEIRVTKIEAWLQSSAKSPNEQALKIRLREIL